MDTLKEGRMIVEIEFLDYVEDVYDITVEDNHNFYANGILIHNCVEIGLPTKEYVDMADLYSEKSVGETAFCALGAINVGKVTDDEYEDIAYIAVRTVDKLIEYATMFAPSMKESIMRRRSIGIGITGLAARLYQNGYDYDGTEESLDYVSKLAETHYYYMLKASQRIAEEDGWSVEGIDVDWLPIDTLYNKKRPLTYDWESLRGKPRKNSVLVAHMPTESSALLSDAPNGLYPIRQQVINKRSRKGVVQYICVPWDKSKKVAWEVSNEVLSRYYSMVQDFTDQAISSDYYFDPSRYEDVKKPLSELMREWVIQARMGVKTQYYINTRDFNGGTLQDVLQDIEDEVEDAVDDQSCCVL